MTQEEIDRAVARATGETVRVIESRGFTMQEEESSDPDADDGRLCIDCPRCRTPILLSDRGLAYLPEAADCDRCDAFFDYAFEEIYDIAPTVPESMSIHDHHSRRNHRQTVPNPAENRMKQPCESS